MYWEEKMRVSLSAFGKAGVKSAQVCRAYKVIFSQNSQIFLLTVWPIPVKHGLATGISNNEKVHHSRFLGHRRVLACPASYGRCSNVSYKSLKSPEHRRSAGGVTTTARSYFTSSSAATHYYCSTSAEPRSGAAAPSAATSSAARSYDWGS
jgi:hypothetical protein